MTAPRRRPSDRRIPYGAVAEIARWTGRHPTTISRIIHGAIPWRGADPHVLRHLYDAGWFPPASDPAAERAAVHAHLLACVPGRQRAMTHRTLTAR